MPIKYLIRIFLIFILISAVFYLNLATSNNCKTFKIFRSSIDFGITHLDGCFSNSYLTPKIKNILSKSPLLYEIARKFRRTYITKSFILDNPPTKEQVEYVDQQQQLSKNVILPFIKGLVGSEFENYKANKENFEFENWNRSHGDHKNSKFHPGKKINKNNIKNLKLIWKYDALKNKKLKKTSAQNPSLFPVSKQSIESNPIFIDRKIISVTANWEIIANDAINGDLVWKLQSLHMPGRRGMVSYHDKLNNKYYLFAPLGNKIYKINVKNGKLEKEFGEKGFVKSFTLVAPLIYKKNLIIVGTNAILVFDIKSGERKGQYSLNPKNKNYLMGNVWGGAALDKKKGIIFVNTGNPHPGIYGVHRPGENENSSSIIAFDLNKKKILWKFQDVSHDLWDFDIAAPPVLHDLHIDDKIYEIVISVTKTGNTLIFERNTGKPIFDIKYKKTPNSDLVGEFAYPYQIFLEKPERFSKIEYGLNDFDKLPKAKIDEINEKIKNAKFGWFETPSFKYDLITFGLHGGAQWMGTSIDPINQFLYIPVNNTPWKIRPYIQSREVKTFFKDELKKYHNLYLQKCSSCHGKNRNGIRKKYKEMEVENIPSLVGYYTIFNLGEKLSSLEILKNKHKNLKLTSGELDKIKELFRKWDEILDKKNEIKIEGNGMAWSQFLTSDGLPASNPPWGYIAKLNLVNGKIEWKAPLGDIKIDGKTLKVGTTNFGGTALNGANILFFTGTEDSKAYAIDADTGEELWSFKMEAAGSTPPTIFEINGKQYVVFLSTGGNYHNFKNKSSTIYTFGIDG